MTKSRGGESGHQNVEGFSDECLFQSRFRVGGLLGRGGSEEFGGVWAGLSHGLPDGPSDGRDGVGAESDAAGRVIKGSPEGDAADVEGFSKGEVSQPLVAHHPADQPFVLDNGGKARGLRGIGNGDRGIHGDSSLLEWGGYPKGYADF